MTTALISTAFAVVIGLAFGLAVVTLYDSLSIILAVVSDHGGNL